MAQEVATGYVTLLPSARGFGRATEQAIGGPLDSASKKGSSALGGMFKKAVGFAAGAAVAIGGYFSAKKIFGGGLDRLMNIEDAQAKLKGLGHDADSVATIMTSALDAVRGTAYGMDAAATVAASAVAAGIKPGQELTKYLQLTADAATIAGTSMDEMGSIMNKVTSSGFAMTDNLNQLADRGIPIFQWLQDEYGVSAEELRKMVSQGKVDAETFNRVISENIGGAALASGETLRGSIANLGASLSRIGANALSGVFPMFRDGVVGITNLLGPVEDAAKRVGEAFGTWVADRAIPAVKSAFETIKGLAETVGPALSGVGGQISAAFAAIGPGVLDGLAPIGDAFMGLVDQVAPLLPGILALATAFNPLSIIFKALLPVLPTLAAAVGDLVSALVGALGPILAALVPVLTEVAGILMTGLMEAFTAILPAVMGILPAITSLVSMLGGVLLTVVQALAPLLVMVADVFVSLLPVITSLIPPIIGIVEALLPIVGIVGELIGALLPPLVELFMAVLGPVLALIAPLVDALAPVLALIGELVGEVLVPWLGFLANILTTVLTAVLPVITALAGGLVSAFTSVQKWVMRLVPAIAGFVSGGIAKVKAFASSVGDSIGNAIQWFRDLPDKIKGVFNGANRWLYDTGKKIIDGLIDGLKGAFERVKSTLSGLTNLLPDWKGPAERDRTLLYGAGNLIIDGLVRGMESQYGSVERSLAGLTSGLTASVGIGADATAVTRPGMGADDRLYATFTDAQVERLARAFEVGSVRSASGVLAVEHRSQAATRSTMGATR